MYEVEVKARLKDREAVMKKLQDLGCKFSEELYQLDFVFIPKNLPFPPPLGTNVLRVRKQNSKSIFNLKIPQKSRQDCIEYEFEISDGDQMIEVIKLLDYKSVPTVEKLRIKTNFKDMEIVLDDVKLLGEFIEVEKIVIHEDYEDRKKIREELFDFLDLLGVPKEDRILDGKYDIMLYEKMKNKI
ncbi:hypothetical protein A3C60_02185 [Candidatus Nomurabacteria bacterium RIFCSPHIGHO2_02_FULL_37_45]|uniref:CYTH domain-containing protein n=2 Tax=Candidatus Nomuraibacteriota TaxID=1752729 RepID=A0A1F6Y382_9BACT|nr:MAG: hypothetical protein A2727_00960 [Candidatus Nomurabacteria bacterium RIFCSPHIGHO2_01_FULL_37_110]OGI72349.1 MAG: hypothetical protein A3C60_02185 [Candidatus Nomurabacteria bacterium RIFCSPHIGHO2_02_FULL_37_45]OGI79231.1 MAG: hypothetical protein A3F19_02060 [Candidatus Nomurabacteria bacterium RIFCSPHIGHO2_12_FULL_37_29]OGI85087.1 MAG: hypothetical protein A3A92_01460 [Candidatus Nomurabacteria bacterium RIFCSPLOWO2_01_FULL_37_49]OGJ00802.1 MAG: hypothetical protein A3G98_01905 [Candi